MNHQHDKDAVLDSFAMEEVHDRATLERYLREYPDCATELVDLSFELRLDPSHGANPAGGVDDLASEAAWKEFMHCAGAGVPMPEPNLFARFRGQAFVALARTLDIPRALLIAVRDGLVEPSSIPSGFLQRFGEAAELTVHAVRAALPATNEVPVGLASKSSTKPTPQRQVTFRELVLTTEMSDGQRLRLLRECDDDDRP